MGRKNSAQEYLICLSRLSFLGGSKKNFYLETCVSEETILNARVVGLETELSWIHQYLYLDLFFFFVIGLDMDLDSQFKILTLDSIQIYEDNKFEFES